MRWRDPSSDVVGSSPFAEGLRLPAGSNATVSRKDFLFIQGSIVCYSQTLSGHSSNNWLESSDSGGGRELGYKI